MRFKLAFALSLFLFLGCNDDDCSIPNCSVSLTGGTAITVTSNVSGGQGTLITPDSILESSLTNSSANVAFKVLKVGSCHKVVGHGHVWSSNSATPVLNRDDYSDFEDQVNFSDNITTVMSELSSNTSYWVRSWIAIQERTCAEERLIFYNDESTKFTTL